MKPFALQNTLLSTRSLPDWTSKVIPDLGLNSNGFSFAAQKGIKYVTDVNNQLIEDDAFLTLGDDVSTQQALAAGKVSGGRSFRSLNFFGENYRHVNVSEPCDPTIHRGGCPPPLERVQERCVWEVGS